MKKILSILLVLVMVVCVLASCGETPQEQTEEKEEQQEQGGGSIVFEEEEEEDADWWEEVDFDGKELTIQLSSTIDTELPNGCDKYMVGPDTQLETSSTSSFERVQNAVYLRNKTCQSKKGLNVKLNYVYIDKVWGSVKGAIVDNEATYGSAESVDIYCDLQYDMFGAGCEDAVFANLLKLTTDSEEGYFDFSKSNGYFMDYMNDNTLSSSRQVIIASDYFMDVLRAMIILPFNMDLYSSYAVTDDPECEKFYELIIDGDWTWDKLMTYQNVFNGSGAATVTDRLLMTLASGGISANAFLYSTAYKTYSYDEATGTLEFLSTCPELLRLFEKANSLATTSGVLEFRGNDITEANEIFTSGNALFGTPNILGIIEEDDFQSLSSLSILPVPKLDSTYDYATVLSSRARVGAISYHSANHAEASAFIQYSTVNSDTVKDEYFNKAMNGKYLVGSGAGEILTLIYDCIGENKSSTLDNLVRAYDWSVNGYLWTGLLVGGDDDTFGSSYNGISGKYTSAVGAKQMVLEQAIDAWNSCAD